MKQAHLADGTVLEFPEETPDTVIDMAVRREMGVEVEMDEEPQEQAPDYARMGVESSVAGLEVSVAHAEAVLDGVEMLGSIAAKLDTLSETVAALANKDFAGEVASSMKSVVETLIDTNVEAAQNNIEIANAMMSKIDNLTQVTAQSSQNLVAAYTAPKVLNRSEDNKTAVLKVQI